jgi:tetratricopeptide (TPR) repeat protein
VDSVEEARIFLNLAKVYTLENKLDSAKFYINKSLNFNIREQDLLRSIYFSLSKIAEKEGNINEALKYFKQYNKYVANQVDKTKAFLELNEKYDFEKLKTENNKLVINQQRTAIISFIMILFASFAVFVFYWISRRNKKLFLESKQEIKTLQMMTEKYLMAAQEEIENLKLKHQQNDGLFALKVVEGLKITTLIDRLIRNTNPKKERLIQQLNMFAYGQNSLDWTILYQAINEIKHGFYNLIYTKYQNLDVMEFRVCCLSCENYLDDTDIAFILGLSIYMVQRKRSDARKKMGTKTRNIYAFFIEQFKKEGIFIAENTK